PALTAIFLQAHNKAATNPYAISNSHSAILGSLAGRYPPPTSAPAGRKLRAYRQILQQRCVPNIIYPARLSRRSRGHAPPSSAKSPAGPPPTPRWPVPPHWLHQPSVQHRPAARKIGSAP